MPSSRSRAIVFKRATSVFNSRSFLTPSFCPSLVWKRRRKICSAAFCSCCWISPSLRFLIFSVSISLSLSGPAVLFESGRRAFHPVLSPVVLPAFLLGRYRNLGIVTLHEARFQRKLVARETHSFLRHRYRNAFHLEEHLARANHGNPVIRSALAFTHT